MQIHGKIIRIVDRATVLINLGKNHGIKNDSIFNIIGNPEVVFDPFTKEELGFISIVKAKVKAAQVHEKFTIASTKWTTTSLKFGESSVAKQIFDLFDTKIIDQGELLVNSDDLQPWKAKSEVPVKVGDIVEVDVSVTATEKISSEVNTQMIEEGDTHKKEIEE